MKKILVISVLALVLIACVAAAGCTSPGTSDTQVNQPSVTTDDPIIGEWFNETGDKKYVFQIDHIGGVYNHHDLVTEIEKSFLWTKNSDGTYTIGELGFGDPMTFSIDAVKGQIKLENGDILYKQSADTSGFMTADDTIYISTDDPKYMLDPYEGTFPVTHPVIE